VSDQRLAQKGDRFEVLPPEARDFTGFDGADTVLLRHLGQKGGAAVVLSVAAELVVTEPGAGATNFSVGDEVKVRQDRDLAGFTGKVTAIGDVLSDKDGRSVHVELTGTARGIWRYRPEWLEPA
jgi:hypothetical protein